LKVQSKDISAKRINFSGEISPFSGKARDVSGAMRLLVFYWRYLFRFLDYYWRARTRYDVHSPFVHAFVESVLEGERRQAAFARMKTRRAALLRENGWIDRRDHGAGSRAAPGERRRVRSLARYNSVSAAVGGYLFHTARFVGASNILELGTSLGISTGYLALAESEALIVTIEGCPQTAAIARRNFQAWGLEKVALQVGSFERELPGALARASAWDLVFLDGDHRQGASLRYFDACLEKMNRSGVFIIADIHWSKEMSEAWRRLREREEVCLSIDLFDCGLLFFKPRARHKEHYTLIRARHKPWLLGWRLF
jgi:predicted O-methyltransferase YrrM